MRSDTMEHAALGASLLCLVHCIALPLLIVFMPALSSVLPTGPVFHLGMLAFAVPASGWTLASGHARHRVPWPLLTGLCGLSLLMLGVLAFEGTWRETAATVAGAVLLAIAHGGNMRLRRHICIASNG